MTFDILPPHGTLKDNIFAYPVRVYYEDTDAGGIVYYANYLKFAERARSEFLRYFEINQQKILEQQKVGFVVRSCHIDYLSSAYLDDALIVTCEITELGAASATMKQQILRGEDVLADINIKLIFLNIETHRPTRICTEITEKIKKNQSSCLPKK